VTSLLVGGAAYASSERTKSSPRCELSSKSSVRRSMPSRNSWSIRAGLLQDAQKVVRDQQRRIRRGALSGAAEFWQAIDVNMSVAGSYTTTSAIRTRARRVIRARD
jgi:hypothetical protein